MHINADIFHEKILQQGVGTTLQVPLAVLSQSPHQNFDYLHGCRRQYRVSFEYDVISREKVSVKN